MSTRRVGRGIVAVLAVSSAAGGQAHASTLTVKVDPPAAGTAQSPQAHTTSIALDNIAPGADGNAKSPPVTLTEYFPQDFAVTLAKYAACPSAKVVHGDSKPDCPEASIVGTAAGSAYVPALLFRTTSDRGYIYKLSDHAVRAWMHFQSPQEVGVIVNGTFATGSAPFGPTITWDFKAIGSGAEAGVEVRVNSVSFVWTQQTGSASTQPPSSSTAGTKRRRAACRSRARRIKNKGKRQRALRRCAKLKAKPKPAPQPATGQPYSALSSTGCTNASWPFRAEMKLADGTTDAADAKLDCTATAPQQSPPPSGGSTSPLCPPVCSSGRAALPLVDAKE
jgi:hypothetical protein